MRLVVDVIFAAYMIEKGFDTLQDIAWFLPIMLGSGLYYLIATIF